MSILVITIGYTPDFMWIWLVFPLMYSFCSRSNPGYQIAFGYVTPVSSGLWQFLSGSLFSSTILTVLSSSGQVSSKMSPKLGLSGVFSLGWGCRFLEEITTEVNGTSHHIMSKATWYSLNITGGVNLHHLVNVVCAHFLYPKLTVFSFSLSFGS